MSEYNRAPIQLVNLSYQFLQFCFQAFLCIVSRPRTNAPFSSFPYPSRVGYECLRFRSHHANSPPNSCRPGPGNSSHPTQLRQPGSSLGQIRRTDLVVAEPTSLWVGGRKVGVARLPLIPSVSLEWMLRHPIYKTLILTFRPNSSSGTRRRGGLPAISVTGCVISRLKVAG